MLIIEPYYSFLLHLSIFFITSLSLTLIERGISYSSKLSEKYLLQPVNRIHTKINWSDYYHLISCVLMNELLISLPCSIIVWNFYWLPKSNINTYNTYYDVFQAWILTLLIEEVLFYSFHRLLHVKFLFKRYHKQHHSWIAPTPFEAMFAHPLDHFLVNVLPVFVAPIVAGLPWSCFSWWGIFSAISASTSHSGIKFLAKAHDLHHLKRDVNYGVLTICDRLFGTFRN